jgi:hypothetical protein
MVSPSVNTPFPPKARSIDATRSVAAAPFTTCSTNPASLLRARCAGSSKAEKAIPRTGAVLRNRSSNSQPVPSGKLRSQTSTSKAILGASWRAELMSLARCTL